jgi:hypothetical protein
VIEYRVQTQFVGRAYCWCCFQRFADALEAFVSSEPPVVLYELVWDGANLKSEKIIGSRENKSHLAQ